MTANSARATAIDAIDVLWITAGLGCDGDTIAMTAATNPSIEDVLAGIIPGLPRVTLYNPVLGPQNADEFLQHFRAAAEGKNPRPFILIVEGSIPNEANKTDGYWAALGMDPHGQPIPTVQWLDWLAARRRGGFPARA